MGPSFRIMFLAMPLRMPKRQLNDVVPNRAAASLRAFRRGVERALPGKVVRVVLFGSRARRCPPRVRLRCSGLRQGPSGPKGGRSYSGGHGLPAHFGGCSHTPRRCPVRLSRRTTAEWTGDDHCTRRHCRAVSGLGERAHPPKKKHRSTPRPQPVQALSEVQRGPFAYGRTSNL
jgi:hypothetical protein